ncbi:MAG: CapA family protein [Candidatus Saccharibacteria bacterium]|nr:CapA family protein [Candidatus Saccharibacteria bacterium]
MKLKKNQKRKSKLVVVLVLIVLIISTLITLYLISHNKLSKNTNINKGSQSQSKTQNPNSSNTPIIHMAAMGDMLAHDTIIANARVGNSYDFAKYFTNIKSAYKNANVVFCNQEGLSSGEQYGISGYPAFNAPTQFSADLRSGAGCNLINLANNHMGDKGVAATNATIDVWSKLHPLAVSGANKSADDQNKPGVFEMNGIKVGFVSFADFNNNNSTPGYSVNNYHDEALVRRLIAQLRTKADVVIVSMHWGIEDSSTVGVEQLNEANLLSSLGADIIIGTGPHVLQKAQIINRSDGSKTVVWYSLGNMLSSQLNLKELIGGIAQFDISKTGGKISIGKLTFTPTYMHYDWMASEAASNNLLARKNAMIYLLNDAAVPLSKSLFNTTVAQQKQYVVDILGPEVTVK